MMLTIARTISLLIQAYEFLIFIRVLLSWVNVSPHRPAIDHPLVDLLYRITDPVLRPLRRIIPLVRVPWEPSGTLDLSPVVALILLEILRQILFRVLLGL